MKHELALSKDAAVTLIDKMSLITKETFDQFVMATLRWYEEESVGGPHNVPNLFGIFYYEEPHSHTFFDIFIESLAWRSTYGTNVPNPHSLEFRYDYYREVFIEHFNEHQISMVDDLEQLLESMSFTFVWDPSEFGEEERSTITNAPVAEVW